MEEENKFKAYNKEVMRRFMEPKNMGEIKDADAVGQVGNMKCLLPDEKIHVQENNLILSIKDLSQGNKVLTHEGVYREILEVHKRNFKGKIITLKNNLGNVSLTEDHLIYAIKAPKKRKFYDIKVKRKLVPAWYHAEDLDKGDIVLNPIYKEIKDLKYLELENKRLKYDFKSNKIPKRVKFDKDLLKLFGYFLAEGHISEGKSRNYITISFNSNETEYIEDVKRIVKKIFNINVTLKDMSSKNTISIHIYSSILARFFKKLFNKDAAKKVIPSIIMNLSPKKQKYLLEGLWKGDGYINLNRIGPRAGYVTISPQLAQQVKIILLRLGIVPLIYVEKEKTIRGVRHKTAYRIHVGQRESLKKLANILGQKYKVKSYESVSSWFDKDYLYTPITRIEKKDYNGEVYNLEVEGSHSYTTESFCVHNCGDIMKVYLKVKDNVIKDIKFQTFGCVAAIASSDALCDAAKGKTIEDAKKINNQDIVKELGDLPAIKLHCSVLGAGALKAAIADYEGVEYKEEEHGHDDVKCG